VRVKVLYFGVLRDRFGVRDELVEVSDGTCVGDLLRILLGRTSNHAMETEGLWRSLAVAVNREYSSPELILCDGDELALLPPVSGGSLTYRARSASHQNGNHAD
jgi:molybdopterin converting factor subunit 1